MKTNELIEKIESILSEYEEEHKIIITGISITNKVYANDMSIDVIARIISVNIDSKYKIC